jgi:hypothetical protein
MNKKTLQPPLLILLDLLFLLVFILLIDSKNNINIELPSDKLFKDAILVLHEDNNEYVINQTTYQKEGFFIPSKGQQYNFYQSCTTQCKDAPNIMKNSLYIYFPTALFNNIAKITYIAIHTSYSCNNLKFKVLDNGKIDLKYLVEKNKCLNQIKGMSSSIID